MRQRERDSHGRFIHDNKVRLCVAADNFFWIEIIVTKQQDIFLDISLKMRTKERKLIPHACGCGELILSLGKQGKPIRFKHGPNNVGRKL